MALADYLVDFLKERQGEFFSGEDLASHFGVSRAGIWKAVKSLEKEGYVFERDKRSGYKLLSVSEKPLEREVKRELNTELIGRSILFYDELDSTNNLAKRLGRKGEPEGTVVIALRQTSGRGRLNRSWISPEGGLYLSILLRPNIPVAGVPGITLLSGLALLKAVKGRFPCLDVSLKWPNDLVIKDSKLGGILCEMDGEADKISFVILGIGLNVNSDVQITGKVTSLSREVGERIVINDLIRSVLEEFEGNYLLFLKEPAFFYEEYRSFSSTLGKRVAVHHQDGIIRGLAVDVSHDGSLVISLPDGNLEKIHYGDVVHLR